MWKSTSQLMFAIVSSWTAVAGSGGPSHPVSSDAGVSRAAAMRAAPPGRRLGDRGLHDINSGRMGATVK